MSTKRAPYVSDVGITALRLTELLDPKKIAAVKVRDLYEARLKGVDELLSLALECVEDDIRACEHKGFMAAAQKFRSLRDRINEHLKP